MGSYGVGRALSSVGDGLFKIAEQKMTGERDQIKMDHDRKMEELRMKNNRTLQTEQFGRQEKLAKTAFGNQQTLATTAFENSKTVTNLQGGWNEKLARLRIDAGSLEAHQSALTSVDTNETALIAGIDPDLYLNELTVTDEKGKPKKTTQGDMLEDRIRKSSAESRTRLREARVNSEVFGGEKKAESESELADLYIQEGMLPATAAFRAKENWSSRGLNPDAVTPETIGDLPLVAKEEGFATPELEAAASVGDPLYSGQGQEPGAPLTELPRVQAGGLGEALSVVGGMAISAASKAGQKIKELLSNKDPDYEAKIQIIKGMANETDPVTGAPWEAGSFRWNQEYNKRVHALIRDQDPSSVKPQMSPQPAPPPETPVPQAGPAQQGPSAPQGQTPVAPQTLGGGGMPNGGGLYDIRQ